MTIRRDGKITLSDGTRPGAATRFDGRIHFTAGGIYEGEFEILDSGWVKLVNDNDVLILLPPHAVDQAEVKPRDGKEPS